MARKTNYTFQKSEREKIRQKKKKEKLERKQDAKSRKAAFKEGGVDPDLEGIEPGPQARPDPGE